MMMTCYICYGAVILEWEKTPTLKKKKNTPCSRQKHTTLLPTSLPLCTPHILCTGESCTEKNHMNIIYDSGNNCTILTKAFNHINHICLNNIFNHRCSLFVPIHMWLNHFCAEVYKNFNKRPKIKHLPSSTFKQPFSIIKHKDQVLSLEKHRCTSAHSKCHWATWGGKGIVGKGFVVCCK